MAKNTFGINELMFYLFLQVREKLIDVTKKRAGMNDQWETRWEYLQLSKLTLQSLFCRSATEYFFFAHLSLGSKVSY